MTERRLIALDELRGLAISAVILSHVALVYRDDSAIAFGLAMPALGVGVDLFFVISGFVIFESAARMIARAPENFWRGASAFWIRRAIRIALPAWATVAAIAAMQDVSGAHGASIGDLAAAAGFYADFHWGDCWAGATSCGDSLVASHFWSLALEMQFYALAPLLVLLPPRALALGGLALLALGAASARPRVSLALAAYWLIVTSILARVLSNAGSGFGLVAIAAIFGVVVASAVTREQSEARGGSRVARKLGELSYSAYLVHLPLLWGVHAALEGLAPVAVSTTAALATVAVATVGFDRHVTRPAAAFARRVSEATFV